MSLLLIIGCLNSHDNRNSWEKRHIQKFCGHRQDWSKSWLQIKVSNFKCNLLCQYIYYVNIFLLFCFLSIRGSPSGTIKYVFFSLQNIFLLNLDISRTKRYSGVKKFFFSSKRAPSYGLTLKCFPQFSWHHKMPEYNRKNMFYSITWEVSTAW